MFSLTRQEQWILVAIVVALLVGAAVKSWRAKQQTDMQATASAPTQNE